MMFKVMCRQADEYGNCLKKPKLWGIFWRSCVEYGHLDQRCPIAERPEKPLKPPPGPPRAKTCPHCGRKI